MATKPSAAFSLSASRLPTMYLLYLDESGNPDNPSDRHFVLGGAAVFERVTYFLSGALDAIQAARIPNTQPVAFHATDMRSGKGFWRGIPYDLREQILADVGQAIAHAKHPGLFLFCAVVEKNAQVFGEAAVRCATEAVVRAFDQFLVRQYTRFDNPQRGIIVFAESHYQQRHRIWVQDFRRLGTQWGAINNLSDIPYFGTPKETRLLQVADMVAHSAFVLFERKNAELIRPFIHRFDRWDGILHGLVHIPAGAACACPHCHSLRVPDHLGDWFP